MGNPMRDSKQLFCFNEVFPYFSHHFYLHYENLPPIRYGRTNHEEPYSQIQTKESDMDSLPQTNYCAQTSEQ